MEIYLYTEPGCGACLEAKSFLLSRGISFEERDVRANLEYLRILEEDLDSCTLPTLVAGDTIIAGFDREEYQRLPKARGLNTNQRSANVGPKSPPAQAELQKNRRGGKKS